MTGLRFVGEAQKYVQMRVGDDLTCGGIAVPPEVVSVGCVALVECGSGVAQNLERRRDLVR